MSELSHDDDISTVSTVRPRRHGIVRLLIVAAVAFALGGLLFRSGGGESSHDHQSPAAAEQGQIWTCSMHPQIRQSGPGSCPLCGMELIPVQSGTGSDPAPNRIVLSQRAARLARLETTPVEPSTLAATSGPTPRLLGRVEADETRLRSVTTWVSGRIDHLAVAATGATVRRGQTIATLYSPEVLAAHQDLVAARTQVQALANAGADARSGAEATLEAVRGRLRLLGFSEDRVDQLARQEQPARQQQITSPVAGVVLERLATEGAWVAAGETLYRVADLARVWAQLDAYERDLPALAIGQNVAITSDSLPGQSFQGKVEFIDRVVDPERRTARIRVGLANPTGVLRPGLLVSGQVRQPAESTAPSSPAAALAVPRSAVLQTGTRALVYVEIEDAESPTYEAREVVLGPRSGEVYPVLSGLQRGERVVTRGAFALDADLQIRGGASLMSDRGGDGGSGMGDPGSGIRDPVRSGADGESGPAPDGGFRTAVEVSLQLHQALADDNLGGAREAAGRLSRFESVDAKLTALHAPAAAIEVAVDLESARAAYQEITLVLGELLSKRGNPLDVPVRQAYCPMATASGGASWLQASAEVENPFLGQDMPACGEVQQEVRPGQRLDEAARP